MYIYIGIYTHQLAKNCDLSERSRSCILRCILWYWNFVIHVKNVYKFWLYCAIYIKRSELYIRDDSWQWTLEALLFSYIENAPVLNQKYRSRSCNFFKVMNFQITIQMYSNLYSCHSFAYIELMWDRIVDW